jgi:hypothetical protein
MHRSAQNIQLPPGSCLADAAPAVERFVQQVVAKLGLKVKLLSVAPNSTPATNDRPEIKRLAFVFEYSGEPDQQDVAAVGTILGSLFKLAAGATLAALEPLLASIAEAFTGKPEAKLEDLVAYMAPEQTTIPGVDLAAGPDQTVTATVDTATGKVIAVDAPKRAKKSQDPQ